MSTLSTHPAALCRPPGFAGARARLPGARRRGARRGRRPWRALAASGLRSLIFGLALGLAPAGGAEAQSTESLKLKPIDRAALRSVMESIDAGDLDTARTRALRSRDGALIDLVTWYTLTDRGNKADFRVFSRFIDERGNWPGQGGLLLRAEQALPGGLSNRALVRWFARHPPVSGNGLLVHLTALKERGQNGEVGAILQERWPSIPTTPVIERRLRQRFAEHIDADLDFRRLDRLLLEGRSVEARRTAAQLGEDHVLLANARLILADNSGGADAAIAEVPEHLMDDPGLALQRASWRRTRGRVEEAASLLLEPVTAVSRPDLWWRERRIVARRLFYLGDHQTAYQVLEAGSGLASEGQDWAKAEFLAGWLALVHLDDRAGAARHFRRLFTEARTPVTKARGAYWLGRAMAEDPDAAEEANRWYAAAAGYPWVYYGQRAADKLGQALDLPAPPPLSPGAARRFARSSAARIVHGLSLAGHDRLATRFFIAMIDQAESPISLNAAVMLARSLGRFDMVVIAARAASRRGFALIPSGHPIPDEPAALAGDPLALAIVRQESQFKPGARSAAGAVGLMQIMPATARETAGRLDLPYDRARLGRDTDYNVTIGRAVIAAALERFDGRLPLALAAYNAGGTQVARWLEELGDPGMDGDALDDFVEAIPYPETRNYVHRVLENERIYRELLARSDRLEARR